MTVRSVIAANDTTYLTSPDFISVYQALIAGRVLDEITATPMISFTVAAVREPSGVPLNAEARVLDGGFYGFSGFADEVFPPAPPTTYVVGITVSAQSYWSASATVAVAPGVALPVIVPDLTLRPSQVRLQGRVTRASDRSPLPGASIRLADDPHPAVPITNHPLSLRQPLRSAHATSGAAGATTVIPLAISGATRKVAASGSAGATVVVLNDRTGLSPGDVIYFGNIDRGDGVFAVLGTPTPAVIATPGAVLLTNPLPADEPAATDAQAFIPSGPAVALMTGVDSGDGLIFTQAAIGSDAVAVEDPAGPNEFGLVGAVADSGGFYRLDGVGHVPSVVLVANGSGLSAGPLEWFVDYGQPSSVVDLQLA
jgi:hypothetical protein